MIDHVETDPFSFGECLQSKIVCVVSDNISLHRLFHALQIQPEYLSKWLIAPPSASDILQCHSVLRCAGIAELTRSVKSTDLGDESKGNDPSTNKESGASLSRLSSGEWATLSTCKRLYAAMALQALVDGTPLMAICRDFHCDPTALDMLHRQARIYLAKIRHFCKAVGYSSLHRIFKVWMAMNMFRLYFHLLFVLPYCQDYKDVLDIASPRELKSLLDIPRMTRRVARALVDNKVSSVEAFVDADPDNLAQAVFIATGFETQDTLETAASSATDGNQSHGDGMGSTSAAMTRDDLLRAHLRAYIAMMQKEARSDVDACSHYPLHILDLKDFINYRTQLSLSEAKLMEEINKRKEPEPGSTEDEGDASDDEVESSSSSSSSSNDEIEDEEEDEEGGVEEEAMQWKETPALQHTTYRNHDTASPLHKHPRLLSPQRPLVAEPEQFASSIALSSPPTPNTRSRGLRKVTITPLTAPRRTVSTEPRDPFSRAVERYVTDEDLLWLMEDLEARGLLVSTAAPDAGNYIEAAGDTMAMPENNVVHYNFVPMEHLEEGNGPMVKAIADIHFCCDSELTVCFYCCRVKPLTVRPCISLSMLLCCQTNPTKPISISVQIKIAK